MKYGEALPQRSVHEWQAHNLDYTDIKELIKNYTTNRPHVARPELATDFENELYEVLNEQLGRIDLFVRSKAGEIDRRIASCLKQVIVLQTRAHIHPKSLKNAARFDKIVRDIERASYELQSLSRFVNVQRTGFHKLLKKYKKWTGSTTLSNRFVPILDSPTAFHRLDFESNVLQVSELLNAARGALNGTPSDAVGMAALKEAAGDRSIIAERPVTAEDETPVEAPVNRRRLSNSQLDLDTALISTPSGGKAVFWVHTDHLIELQMILLKHLVLQPNAPNQPLSSSPPLSRRSSTVSVTGKNDEVGFIVLDDLQYFSNVQSGATVDKINQAGMRTSGQVRWCSRDGDAVIAVSDFADAILDGRDNPGAHKIEVRVKRRSVESILDLDSEYLQTEINGVQPVQDIDNVRQWLKEHPRVTPLVKVLSTRTRFTSNTNENDLVCAVLDKDIRMTRVNPGRGLMTSDEDKGEADYTSFPHSVCEVQWDGTQPPSFVKELIESYIVEHVPGFSLGVHAVAALYEPKLDTPPYWLSLLQKDIRKTPAMTRRRSRRSFSNHPRNSSKSSSATETTPSLAQLSTDAAEVSTPPTSASGLPPKRPRKAESQRPKKKKLSRVQSLGGTRYWNEFDDEEAEQEPYTVSIHPRSISEGNDSEDKTLSEFLMGRFKSAAQKVGRIVLPKRDTPTERTPLLGRPESVNSETSSDLDIESAMGMRVREQARSAARARMAFMTGHIGSLAISVLILIFTAIMAFTTALGEKHHRKKHIGRGIVLDIGVFVGVMVSLAFAIAGLTVFLTSKARVGYLHTALVWLAFGIVAVGGGCMFALVGNEVGVP